MYFKNFEPEPKTGTQYVGLKQNAKFLFPNVVKSVTWFIVAAIVIASSAYLIFYGFHFGMVKTYLWMTIIVFSVCMSVLVIAPIRILIFGVINLLFAKRKPIIIMRKVYKGLLRNPEDPFVKERVLRFRQYNAELYAPTPLCKLQTRKEDIVYNIELRNLTIDIIAHVFFMGVVTSLIQIHMSQTSFYSTQLMQNLIINGNYTKSIPFSKVNTYETFMEYLNNTFIPALLMNRSMDGEDIFSRGWTMNPDLKLLGKPRLRQVRVRKSPCQQIIKLNVKELDCAPDLTLLNVERGDFSLGWDPDPSKAKTERQASPWKYHSALATESLPNLGKLYIYPGGGYILGLPRDAPNAHVTLKFVKDFQWIDPRTRAVFIEFTVYCVNVNLFNTVTLLVEMSSLGYYVTSYQIFTSKLMFLSAELYLTFTLKSFLFICLLLIFMVRESARMHRTSIIPYLKRGMALLNLAVLLLGLLTVALIFGRTYYVLYLFKKLEEAENNEFISFFFAATWDHWSKKIKGFLISFSVFKLFILMTFRVVLFKFQTILSFCYKYFLNLYFKQLVFICAFAMFFNSAIGNYAFIFSSIDNSILSIILRSAAMDTKFDTTVINASPWYLGSLFLVFFFISVTVLFVDVFTAVTCLYLEEVKKVHITDRYDIVAYIKHVFSRQQDILYQKDEHTKNEDSSVMRLKGGGNKTTKVKTRGKKMKFRGRRKKAKEVFEMKLRTKDLVKKKHYDTVEYQDLAPDRALAMKNMMLSLLSEKEKTVECARQKALEALFYSFISEKKKLGTGKTSEGPYYFVWDKDLKRVHDSTQFLEMIKIVKETLRNKGWLQRDEEIEEEMEEKLCDQMMHTEDKLSILNKKLCRLARVKDAN